MIERPDFSNLDFLPFRGQDRLLPLLGEAYLAHSEQDFVLRLEPHAHALNAIGIIHGGAMATLFDIVLHEAAHAQFNSQTVTASLEIKYLRPGQAGSPIYIVAQNLKTGRSLAVCIGAAFQNDQLIAYASGQFAKTAPPSDSSPLFGKES